MLKLDDFSYCKAANACYRDLIFRHLFCCQHYFLRIQMPVIFNFFNTRDLYCGVRRTPNQIDIDVTCSKSCDQWKITKRLKDNQG